MHFTGNQTRYGKKYIMLLSVGLLLDKDGELREDDG